MVKVRVNKNGVTIATITSHSAALAMRAIEGITGKPETEQDKVKFVEFFCLINSEEKRFSAGNYELVKEVEHS